MNGHCFTKTDTDKLMVGKQPLKFACNSLIMSSGLHSHSIFGLVSTDVTLNCTCKSSFCGVRRRVLLRKGSVLSSSWKRNWDSKRPSWCCLKNSDRARFRRRALCRRWWPSAIYHGASRFPSPCFPIVSMTTFKHSAYSCLQQTMLCTNAECCWFLGGWLCSHSSSSGKR